MKIHIQYAYICTMYVHILTRVLTVRKTHGHFRGMMVVEKHRYNIRRFVLQTEKRERKKNVYNAIAILSIFIAVPFVSIFRNLCLLK